MITSHVLLDVWLVLMGIGAVFVGLSLLIPPRGAREGRDNQP